MGIRGQTERFPSDADRLTAVTDAANHPAVRLGMTRRATARKTYPTKMDAGRVAQVRAPGLGANLGYSSQYAEYEPL